jgi:hypothetical protein
LERQIPPKRRPGDWFTCSEGRKQGISTSQIILPKKPKNKKLTIAKGQE